MVALAVVNPLPQFFELDGDPLDNGSVYFGTVAGNPVTSPVSAVWDDGTPVNQPARTRNGYFYHAGRPSAIKVDGDYSMLVLDKRGRTVQYTANSAEVGNASSLLLLITTFISNLAASTGAALIGFIQAGVGAVARTVLDKLREQVSVLDFGGVMNDPSPAIRTANSAAIIAAAVAGKRVYVPAGTLWVDPNMEVPFNLNLTGAGKEATILKGDGDLFKFTSAAPGSVVFRDFAIMNDVTRGKLFRTAAGVDLPPIIFERITFGKSNYHFSCTDTIVHWKWLFCHGNDAAIASRFLIGAFACWDIGCYWWFNAKHLQTQGAQVSSCGSDMTVYEYATGYGVHLLAAGFDILGWAFDGCHLEGNGSAAGLAEVHLETTTGNRIVGVRFIDCGIYPGPGPAGARVLLTAGGGGAFGGIEFEGGFVAGTTPLVTANVAVTIHPSVNFQVNTIPAISSRPVQVQYQNSLSFLGSVRVNGVFGGNGAVQALVTPPAGTRTVKVVCEGNNYNGAPNTNIALLEARYSATNGNVRATVDVNHSAGANQGFVASWTGTQVQVANKVGMGFSQSGDTLFEFWG